MNLIYLDHNSTAPAAPEVVEAVRRALADTWANPVSPHGAGRAARAVVEDARAELGALLGAPADTLLFTSGGTEADNLAVFGGARARAADGRHIVISNVEHPAVDEAVRGLEGLGFRATRVPVGPDGRVDAGMMVAAFAPDTVLVSLMLAQNETGALQPVREVAQAARKRGITVHTDAAQAVGKLPVDVEDLGVDLLTIAGHKMYGPKGVGALYVRSGTRLLPHLVGASHERGLRPGTENTPGIAGLGAAAALARHELGDRVRHARALTSRLLEAARAAMPDVRLNGPSDAGQRLPNTLNLAFPGVRSDRLMAEVPGLAISGGAACHSGSPEPSRVLLAMGVDAETARCAVRISVGRGNSETEMTMAAQLLTSAARRLLNR